MTIEIPGIPIALERPRFSGGHAYDSQTREKALVRLFMNLAPKTEECQYYAIKILFCFGSRDPLDLWNIQRPTRKDLDNLVKFYLDCGNGILWKDDRQIVKIECVKIYSKKSFTKIDITPIYSMKKSHEKLFSIMSPEELTEFRHDFLTICSGWNINDIIQCSETEEYRPLAPMAAGLMSITKKWYEKFKKINSIKDE